MKVTAYLRVAQTERGFLFGATSKPSAAPLSSSPMSGPLPTRQFKLVLDLPASAFDGVDGEVHAEVPPELLSRAIPAEVAGVNS